MPTALGPVGWIAIAFRGASVHTDVVPALAELVGAGTVRIIDLLLLRKDGAGVVTASELEALDPAELAPFDSLDGDVLGLLTEDDIALAGGSLDRDGAALLIVWEPVGHRVRRRGAPRRRLDRGRGPGARRGGPGRARRGGRAGRREGRLRTQAARSRPDGDGGPHRGGGRDGHGRFGAGGAARHERVNAASVPAVPAPPAPAPAAPAPAPAPVAGGPVITDAVVAQITRLGDLLAAGLLTEEEFATQKARVLGT